MAREHAEEDLRGVMVGCGFFAQLQLDGWTRVTGARIAAVCDIDRDRAGQTAKKFNIPAAYGSLEEALDAERFAFADIVTRPEGREAQLEAAAKAGLTILCQKPFAKDLAEARARVALVESHGAALGINENFRHGPWFRRLKQEIADGALGRVHSALFRIRFSDGVGPDAYIDRQPYFRTMPRMLAHETLVHQLSISEMLFGRIESIYARMQRVNPAIVGEDWVLIVAQMDSGVVVTIDANRVAPLEEQEPTFGRVQVLGSKAEARIGPPGTLRLLAVGGAVEREITFDTTVGYRGDVCRAAQQHFIDCLRAGGETETSGRAYLKTLAAVEAAYLSAAENRVVRPAEL